MARVATTCIRCIFEARHVDTLSFIADAYRNDIEIEGGCLREECAALDHGPDADQQANL